MTEDDTSISRACKIVSLDRSMFYYRSVKDDSEVEAKLMEYALHKQLSNRGCPEYYKRIRKEGLRWNHKRVERIYRKLGMNKKKKTKRRIPNPVKTPLVQPLAPNLTWSMDFMEDRLDNGRKIRILNILDDYGREALMMRVGYSFPSSEVIEVLNQVIEWRGRPRSIRTDNGTEFMAEAFKTFCKAPEREIEHIRIQKGKPSQNGFVERFNRSYREGVLDAFILESKEQAQRETDEWMEDYNHHHPHDSLGDMTPSEYTQKANLKIA